MVNEYDEVDDDGSDSLHCRGLTPLLHAS